MKNDAVTKLLLSVIALALMAMAIRPYFAPRVAHAEGGGAYPVYIEPGVQMLKAPDGSKQLYGRVVVDLRTGKIWGFPTITTDPYPFNAMNSKPQVSRPFELGRFAFQDMNNKDRVGEYLHFCWMDACSRKALRARVISS